MPRLQSRFSLLCQSAEWLARIGAADMARLPYVFDREQLGTIVCLQCNELNTSARLFDGYAIGSSSACRKNVPTLPHFQQGA